MVSPVGRVALEFSLPCNLIKNGDDCKRVVLAPVQNRHFRLKAKGLDKRIVKLPAHEVVYRRMREMILYGELAPGQAVTIQGLVKRLDVGMTPVREAIRRLTAEGALEFQGNRRVSVPELTPQLLEELGFARLAIEPRLSELAAERMPESLIYALETMDNSLNASIDQGDVGGYLSSNYQFHMALYEASEAEILISIVRGLWMRMGPSLRVVCGRFGTANLPDKHEEALEALRRRDPEAVAEAIRADIEQGIDQVGRSL